MHSHAVAEHVVTINDSLLFYILAVTQNANYSLFCVCLVFPTVC